MGTKKISFFDSNKQIDSTIISIFLDKSIVNRYKTLYDYCHSHGFSFTNNDQKKLIQFVEKTIYKQVYLYSHLLFRYMQVSGNWGAPGEQQVKISFCRNLLKVGPLVQLTTEHAQQFEELIKKTTASYGIGNDSKEELTSKIRGFKFSIFGKEFDIYKAIQMHRFLKFSGSNKFLHVGQYSTQMELIMGYGKEQLIHGHHVVYVEKEYIRTPNNVMAMAAIVGNQSIFIRLESLNMIFSQKWLQIFDYNEFDILSIHSEPVWNIAEGIKQQVLELYGINTKEELNNHKQSFIIDMSETILHHEFGHGILHQELLSYEENAIGDASKIFGETVYTSLLGFLSDFSFNSTSVKGPIKHMVDISKTDRIRARRMYLMYLSDAWFYNTEDKYMYTYSDLIVLMLIRYIKIDDINFEQLEKDMANTLSSPFSRILGLYKKDVHKLQEMATQATFNINNTAITYSQLRDYLIAEFKKNDGYVHPETFEFMVPFWTNIFGYIQSSSNAKDIIASFLESQKKIILKKIMVLSCGKEMALKYDYDFRQYIVDHLYKLKVIAVDPNHN